MNDTQREAMDKLARIDEETGLSERDVVVSLRMLASGLVPVVEEKVMREAADEIVRLRQDLVLFANELNVERAKVASLVDHAVRLEAERDEARREACGHDETIGGAMLEAARRGWDCFKEDGK